MDPTPGSPEGYRDQVLNTRLKTMETLLSYLKAKARIMAIGPTYASASCGIVRRDGVGYVDKNGVPMVDWFANLSLPADGDGNSSNQSGLKPDSIENTAVTVTQVTEVMELLLKRALAAEAQAELEREKFRTCDEEVRRKSSQIEGMWGRVEEMERVAVGTSGILKEMQLKLEDMEHEASRQRQRANENEQELSRVRRDFGILKSSVDSLVKARETIRSMERRIHEVEVISERLSARVGGLEAGKRDSEVEIRNLLLENDKLRGDLDVKEAELAAASDQFKRLVFTTSS